MNKGKLTNQRGGKTLYARRRNGKRDKRKGTGSKKTRMYINKGEKSVGPGEN